MLYSGLFSRQLICKIGDVSRVTNVSNFSPAAFQVCLTQGREGVDLWVGAWEEGLVCTLVGTPLSLGRGGGTKTSVELGLLAVSPCALGH